MALTHRQQHQWALLLGIMYNRWSSKWIWKMEIKGLKMKVQSLNLWHDAFHIEKYHSHPMQHTTHSPPLNCLHPHLSSPSTQNHRHYPLQPASPIQALLPMLGRIPVPNLHTHVNMWLLQMFLTLVLHCLPILQQHLIVQLSCLPCFCPQSPREADTKCNLTGSNFGSGFLLIVKTTTSAGPVGHPGTCIPHRRFITCWPFAEPIFGVVVIVKWEV